jgi:hypothetical protein
MPTSTQLISTHPARPDDGSATHGDYLWMSQPEAVRDNPPRARAKRNAQPASHGSLRPLAPAATAPTSLLLRVNAQTERKPQAVGCVGTEQWFVFCSAPGEHGLFKVIDTLIAVAQQRDLTQLKQDRGRGRMQQIVAQRQLQHRTGALRDRDEPRLAVSERVQTDPVHGMYLLRRRPEPRTARRPQHDGRYDVARPRRVVIKPSHHAVGGKLQAQLLVKLPQRGIQRRLTVIQTAPGQGPLAGVTSQPRRSATEQHCCPASNSDHPPVQLLDPRPDIAKTGQAEVLWRQRLDVVYDGIAVYEDHSDSGVTTAFEWIPAPHMTTQSRLHTGSKALLEHDHIVSLPQTRSDRPVSSERGPTRKQPDPHAAPFTKPGSP